MSQNSGPEAAILTLDAEKIGDAVVRLGLVSYALGHESIRGTLNPYLNHPELLSPEGQFIYDLLTRSTQEFIDRWYGGASGAIALNDFIASRLLEGAEPA